jgi:TolB protein
MILFDAVAVSMLLLAPAPPARAGGAELVDPRDGKRYPLVEIAGLTWMARNLDHRSDGSFCYDDDPHHCDTDGALYRWEAALAACPPGWHLASELEWQALELATGLAYTELEQRNDRGTVQGARLKPGGDLGFDVQYAGWRRYEGERYDARGRASAYWTSTESDLAHAMHRDIDTGDDMIWRSPVVKHYALSVRCVRDRYARDEYAGQDTHPAWSPDGGRIAYISNREGVAAGSDINFEVYVLDLATKRERRLTENQDFEADIAWSPDGGRIAFKSHRDGNDEVYLMDADGAGQTNLTRHPASDGGASFSPDGARLVFHSDRDGDKELYLMNADGTDVRRLTDHPAGDHSPRWSPDGTRIAFVSDRDGNDEVYTSRPDGTDVVRVTREPLPDWYPVWAPDGGRLVITRGDPTQDEWVLVVMNPDGSGAEQVYAGNDSGNADWSPDGSTLAFGATTEQGRGRVFLSLRGGSNAEPISGRLAGTFE